MSWTSYRPTASGHFHSAKWEKFRHIWACIFISCLRLRIGGVSQQFSLQILHIVKCKISESLEKYHKYLRNIFHSNDPCRDRLNYLVVFDSKDSRLGSWNCLLPIFTFGFAGFLNGNYNCRRITGNRLTGLLSVWTLNIQNTYKQNNNESF